MYLNDFLKDTYFRKNLWEFFLIVEDVLWIKKEDIYSKNIKISNSDYETIKNKYFLFVEKKVPIEYVLNYSFFMGEKFFVNENVLIPRPETEYLVNYALKIAQNYDIIFDIWTWSGIIWITLAKKTWKKVVLSDISYKALEVAKENKKRICDNCDIEIIKSNLWEHLTNYEGKKLVCANLPYVDENFLVDEYTSKEPHLALFAPNNWKKLYEDLINTQKNIDFLFEMTKKQATFFQKQNPKFKVLPTCHENIKILFWKL